MASPRERLGVMKVVNEMPFVVYGYEPSTGYMWFSGGFAYERDAIEKAKSRVDDATRSEGWVYQRNKSHYQPIGRAYLIGDGGTEYEVWKTV